MPESFRISYFSQLKRTDQTNKFLAETPEKPEKKKPSRSAKKEKKVAPLRIKLPKKSSKKKQASSDEDDDFDDDDNFEDPQVTPEPGKGKFCIFACCDVMIINMTS